MLVQHSSCSHFMSTKLIGDIAEQYAILAALSKGWGVSCPIGDRHPYDLIFDIKGRLLRIQVKSAYSAKEGHYIANTRRAKTNRKVYKYDHYEGTDFDFGLIWHPKQTVFYVIPMKSFLLFRSGIILTAEGASRNRPNRASEFREARHLLDPTIPSESDSTSEAIIS